MPAKSSALQAVGEKYHAFKVTKLVEIKELQCVLKELIHEPTGAQILHIANDDPENVFCLAFRTLPESSNGVAHILEHTVLCGSQKFPVKDPFFAMRKRSLNTFMNALTGTDFTCYPAASQVPKDFYNLLDVYLDAVFKPNLRELSFLQEGHRLEFSAADDSKSPLEYKGIVFNEMKGQFSSPDYRLWNTITKNLFSTLPYRFVSGGDPKVIPHLSYKELLEFHKKYYHPSRCLFFFYGNMPLEKHLHFIETHALDGVKKLPRLPSIGKQERFSKPKTCKTAYPISPEDDAASKTLISLSWLTCDILHQEDLLALCVIEIALMGTDAAPLKIALLKSGLCKQADVFMDNDISEIPFTIMLKGCEAESVPKLKALIKKTLKDIASTALPEKLVEGAIHQLEFQRSEITGDDWPFGLSLFMRAALLKQHGGRAEDGLMIHSLFDKLRKKIRNPKYLPDLIKKHLIDNPHFLTVVQTPDKDLAAQELAEERKNLDSLQAKLRSKDKEKLVQQAQTLLTFQKQQEKEDLEILPRVTLKDIQPKVRTFPLKQENAGNLQLFHHSCFTNNIVYADLVFDLPDTSEEDLPYTRLLSSLLSEVGCGPRDYKANLEYTQEHVGGIGAALALNLQASKAGVFKPSFLLTAKSLRRKVYKLFPLMLDTVSSPDFKDIDRLRELLMQLYTGMENALPHNALRYASHLSASGLSISSKISNAWYGLDYFWTIRSLAKNFEKNADFLADKLTNLQNRLLCVKGAHLILGCDDTTYKELKKEKFFGLQDLPTRSLTPWKGDYALPKVPDQGRLIASPVAFISKVFRTIPYMHPEAPALSVAALIFENKTLHEKIREQGGAYGSRAVNDPMSGEFYFCTYRDPNISLSLAAFEDAVNEVSSGRFDKHDLEEAKLRFIQRMDAPISPGNRAITSYSLWREGKTTEMRQGFRDKLLSLSKEEVMKATERYLVPGLKNAITVAFSGQELLDRENIRLKKVGFKPLKILQV